MSSSKKKKTNDKPKPRVRPDLSGTQRRHLRGLAHDLKPIVNVGHQGVTEALLASVEQALDDHELIKVKINPNNDDPLDELGEALAAGTLSALVQRIGRIVVLYRPDLEDPRIVLP